MSNNDVRIAYYPETDTLVLGMTGSHGESIGGDHVIDLVAFRTAEEGPIVGVVLERAAELLRPYLCGGVGSEDILGDSQRPAADAG